jgi:hypothetical protein
MSEFSPPPVGGESQHEPSSGTGLHRNLRRLSLGLVSSLMAMAAISGMAAAGASAASTVRALLLDSNGSQFVSVAVTAGTPATTGTYTFDNVPNGSYKIYFVDHTGADDVEAAYYGGATAFASATTTTISANQTLAPVTLFTGGSISGSITEPNIGVAGTGIQACLVGAPDPGQVAYWGASTDGQLCSAGSLTAGGYTIGGLVPGDSYDIYYTFGYPAQGWADNVYDDGGGVTLDQGSATTATPAVGGSASASFSIPALGSISGVATDPSGVANTALNVDLFDSAGSVISDNETFANGIYTVDGVLPGSYKVEFVPSSPLVAAQYYNNSATLAGATALTVGPGSAATAINATLTSAATVSGTVTAAQGGADLGGLEVDAVDASGNVVSSTFTNANGTYALTGLPAGSWYLRFDGGQAFSGMYYTAEYYGGSATLAGSVAVKLTAGEALIDANQALMATSTVRPGAPTVASGKLSGLYNDKVALSFKLTAGSGTAGYLESFRIKLPKNVSWNKKTIKKDLVIAHDTYTEVIKSGQLLVTFPSGKKSVTVQIKAGGVTVTKSIEKLAAAHRIASYGIDVSATDTTGLTTSLSYTVKNPH